MALELNKVSFSARRGFWMRSKKILSDMDLSLKAGAVIGLVGPNGAGKTTTIKLGAGLLQPDSGKILINGYPATDTRARKAIGLLTEEQYIYTHLRLKEWLIMLAGFSGLKGPTNRRRVNDVLELFGLTDRADQMMRTLSKGQIQRAGLAQALVQEPEILLLDEPMSGLDPYWRFRVQHIMSEFKKAGGSILFSSHILVDVERLSDEIALIKDGRLQWKGALSDLQRDIKSYEVICQTENPDMLKRFASEEKIVRQPDGKWIVSIPKNAKNDVLRLASNETLVLESLLPLREEIEEILFGFSPNTEKMDQ